MRRAKTVLARWGIIACLAPFIGLFYCLKFSVDAVEHTIDAVADARKRYRIKTRHRPKSKPLAVVPSASRGRAAFLGIGTSTSFLHLPLEIRLIIYRLALGAPAIVQVRVRHSFWGGRPSGWELTRGIRGDGDEPSKTLRTIIGLGGSGLRPVVAPPTSGCVTYSPVSQLILGDTFHSMRRRNKQPVVSHVDLMRTCRIVYGDVLAMLYSGNTISLFGIEMARYFCRNASPEGMRGVRFTHLALTIPSDRWDSSSQRKSVEGTMRLLQKSLPSLRQLDVEVALVWGQPKDPQRFWAWLKTDVLGQLRNLERFVLKVSAYARFEGRPRGNWDAWTPQYEPLVSWDDDEYLALKTRAVTARGVGQS